MQNNGKRLPMHMDVAYTYARHWYLSELRVLRAMVRVGSKSQVNAAKERKFLQRALARLRSARYAAT